VTAEGPEPGAPVFRDRRRIDPTTFEVREPAPPGGALGPERGEGDEDAAPDTGALDADLAELTADLQRLSAEYANYRKRVERDREAVREHAVSSALVELLPVIDYVGRSRQLGELEGAFRSVGEALEAVVTRLGLEPYAEAGDAFDPQVHEALSAVPTEEPGEPVLVEVYQPGYRFKGRVVRPARVVVTAPSATPPEGGEPV
jgi:molecular chaperone GrpE